MPPIRNHAILNAEWFSKIMVGKCLYCKKEFREREKKYKFCSLICSSNYNKNGLKKVTLPPYSEALAEFIGILLGDGSTTLYQTSVTLNSTADKEYIPYVLKLIKKLFPEATVSIVVRKDNATDVKINSFVVSLFLREKGIVPRAKEIPLWIFSDFEYIKACVKGLFDTEGSISFKEYESKLGKTYYKQLNFRNTDIVSMKFVRDTLLKIGLKPTMALKKSLYISNQKDIDTFREKIGFSNPKLMYKSIWIKPEM